MGLHGQNKYTEAKEQEDEKAKAEVEQKAKQERLNDLLGAFREQLFPYKDQIQPMFAEMDKHGDGHCDYDQFRELLGMMGVQVENEDMDLLMESFFDPDVEDQTRPMSITVLDEALFG